MVLFMSVSIHKETAMKIKHSLGLLIMFLPAMSYADQLINDYNAHFQTNLATPDQVLADANTRMKNYFNNLRECMPGTYQYAMAGAMPMSFVFPATVIEKQNEVCVVTTSYDMPPQGKVEIKCRYSVTTLPLFTDKEAENLVLGDVSFDSAHLTPLQEAIKTACQMLINGKPVQQGF